MISNKEVYNVFLPCPNRTDVQIMKNWIYNLNASAEAELVPKDIPKNANVWGDTDDKFDQREKGSLVHELPPYHSRYIPDSPAHIAPYFSDHFTGTSTEAACTTLDNILSEMRSRNTIDVERDSLIYAMHQQHMGMM